MYRKYRGHGDMLNEPRTCRHAVSKILSSSKLYRTNDPISLTNKLQGFKKKKKKTREVVSRLKET